MVKVALCLSMTKTVSGAEKKNGLAIGSVATFIRNNNNSKTSFYHDIVNERFDDLYAESTERNVSTREPEASKFWYIRVILLSAQSIHIQIEYQRLLTERARSRIQVEVVVSNTKDRI